MELDDIKNFLRIDGIDDDSLILSLQLAAEQYLENAGAAKNYTSELYKIAVKLLVGHWYENRSAVVIGTVTKDLEFSLINIIVQLRNSGGD